MLRAARFVAKLGVELGAKTAEPIKELAPLLGNIPAARLFEEVCKLFMTGHAAKTLEALQKFELSSVLFPVLKTEGKSGRILTGPLMETAMKNTDERIAVENGRPAVELGPDALAVMQGYTWPGNVRQLRNVAEWLTIMIPQDGDLLVKPDNLPPAILHEGPSVFSTSGTAELMSLPLRSAREEFERQYLEAQVLRFGGNITKTAAFIGMERSALHRKLRALSISSNGERM